MEHNEKLIQEIEDIKKQIARIPKQETPTLSPAHSAELNELFAALAKAQSEMPIAKTDSTNPFFKSKYADLTAIVKVSRPSLSKNGLAVTQLPLFVNGREILFTRLTHSSGQWIECTMPLNPPKSDAQTRGSYMTYMKRYSYAAITGVVAEGEDDDAEAAMAPSRAAAPSTESKKITQSQRDILRQEIGDMKDVMEELLKSIPTRKLSDMPASKYTNTLNKIREIKKAREA